MNAKPVDVLAPYEYRVGDVGGLHQPGAPRTVGDFIGWLACDVLCAVLILGGLWAAGQVQP